MSSLYAYFCHLVIFSTIQRKIIIFFSKEYVITLLRIDYISNIKVVYTIPIKGFPKHWCSFKLLLIIIMKLSEYVIPKVYVILEYLEI